MTRSTIDLNDGQTLFICELDDAPTFDAVAVVRCRDCKSAKIRDDMGEDFYECAQNGVTVFCKGGHFCGYGAPRSQE